MVQLSRPVRIKKTPFRSRQSVRSSVTYKNPAKCVLTKHNPDNINEEPTDVKQNTDEEQNNALNGSTSESLEGKAHVILLFLTHSISYFYMNCYIMQHTVI